MVTKKTQNFYLSLVMLLLCSGIILIFSASSISAGLDQKMNDSFFFMKRQFLSLFIGIIALCVFARIDYHIFLRFWPYLYIVTLLLLIAVLVVGKSSYNAQRWLKIGPFHFQPSELAKFTAVISIAAFAIARHEKLSSFWKGFVPSLLLVFPLVIFIMIQPDLGTAFFVFALSMVVLFTSGIRLKHILLTGSATLPLLFITMFFSFSHVQKRIFVFLDPEADKLGKGHQIYQSLIALGSGGFSGKGLGNSTQKLFFLPEEHTDFIFAIIVEELGFLGGGFILMLFLLLVYAGYRVSKHARDPFGSLITLGLTGMIVLQSAMNIAVVTASVPTKGIGLPFLSFGGSNLLVTLMSVGVVLNVARQGLSRSELRRLRISSERPPTSFASLPPGAEERSLPKS